MSDLGVEQWMDLVISRAAALRAAGVTTITIGGVTVTLAPPEPAPIPTTPDARSDENNDDDPLSDPSTFGGRGVPGFTRPTRSEDF